MTEKLKPHYFTKLKAISQLIEEEIIKDVDFARGYLEEGGVDIDQLTTRGITTFNANIAALKQREGLKKQDFYQAKLVSFKKAIQGLTLIQLQVKFPAIPKIAARSFDDGKFSQKEMDELMTDGSFLSFLESDFDETSE